MDSKELKQKIRKLKKLELMYRYGLSPEYIIKNADSLDKMPLVWKDYFNLCNSNANKARYSFSTLKAMDKEQLKQVIDEFWFQVFYLAYQEKGIRMEVQDPELLAYLGLPYDSDRTMIKKRFHELCKKFHPDEGGDENSFIELMDMMEKYELK